MTSPLRKSMARRDELSRRVRAAEWELDRLKRNLHEVNHDILRACPHEWRPDLDQMLSIGDRRDVVCGICGTRDAMPGR